MTASPQLRALGGDIRILCAVIDALIAGAVTFEEAWNHRLVQCQILVESGSREGWNEDAAGRVLTARGWKDADGIYNAAGIPEKHRRVIDLALWRAGEPVKKRKGHFTIREIADLTGHPYRTVEDWVHTDIAKLKRLGDAA
jgi:hypothetical protein